eukprot:gene1002-1526_t
MAPLVDESRVRELQGGKVKPGAVVYWCSRDQRVNDNWALLYAAEKAQESGSPLAVVFNLVPKFLGAGARQFGFMLRGIREMAAELEQRGIKFALLEGDPVETLPKFVEASKATLLVTDMSPLRLGLQWREGVANAISIPFHEVDAHNVVPVWEASDKKEVGARTLRGRLAKHYPQYLVEFPELPAVKADWPATDAFPPAPDWDSLIDMVVSAGSAVPEVAWAIPGERAALAATHAYLNSRLSLYEHRNKPEKPQALSGLSPYLHFGQVSGQRVALEAKKFSKSQSKAVESFVEELVVRRELSDNFCFYEKNYDKLEGQTYQWALDTLAAHAQDKRPYVYSLEKLEQARTHDDLWNTAQLEMVYGGKMHGFMRMYWAKKILEWTASPEQALEYAIYLNDKYQLDGRDPNGYVGCLWSIAGVHDQGWKERDVFGKIRYMTYDGCKKKFDIPAYAARVKKLVAAVKSDPSAISAVANPGGFTPGAGSAASAGAKTPAKAAGKGTGGTGSGGSSKAEKAPLGPPCDKETLLKLTSAATAAAKESSEGTAGADVRAADALRALQRENISAALLADTQVGKQIKKLCKHKEASIAAAGKDLITQWQKTVLKAAS